VAVELDVIDVLKHPEAGLRDRVLVTPMLIKLSPGPERRIVGTLKDTGALVSALGLAEGS
jgi:circadian clock protein KaiB